MDSPHSLPLNQYFLSLPDGRHSHQIPPIVTTNFFKDSPQAPWAPKVPPNPSPPAELSIEIIAEGLDVQPTDPTETFAEKYGTIKEFLGRGGWGEVRLAHKSDSEVFAVKKLLHVIKEPPAATALRDHNAGQAQSTSNPLPEYTRRELLNKRERKARGEYYMSSNLDHRNIAQALDLMRDENGNLLMVMEFCGGGCLHDFVFRKQAEGTWLVQEEADCFFLQIIHGLAYLHGKNITHGDLKLQNVLLTEWGCAKISDFGNAHKRRRFKVVDHKWAGARYTAKMMLSPQMFVKDGISFNTATLDVWAAGVMYTLMRTGRYLWSKAHKNDPRYAKYLRLRREKRGSIFGFEDTNRDCVKALFSLFDPDAETRFTAAQLLDTPWLKSVKLCEAGTFGF